MAILVAIFIAAITLSQPISVQATDNQTYTQQFQNSITTLSGKSVEANMYFTKMDYWDLKKVTFNFNYQISQLANRQASDITVSLNGVKFYSFRPKDKTGFQTEKITVPLDLVSGSNRLTITGQVLDQMPDKNYQLQQTPANWLTIGNGSNVNFEYQLKEAENTLSSFYAHFSGQDTIAYQKSKIATADNPTAKELTASMVALSGESRIITTENDQIPVVKLSELNAAKNDYMLVVAQYDHLPDELKKQIDPDQLKNKALIKTYYTDGKYYLIVTAKSGALLEKAARFVANEELMKETDKDREEVDETTDTYTSSLHDNGTHYLTTSADRIEGAGHKESSYLVQIQKCWSNHNEVMTCYSQITPRNNETYDDIAVVAPKTLNTDDFKTLTNIFNLIGNFAKSNTGRIQFYKSMPSQNVLKNSNVIVLGTPRNNSMIKKLNPNLYFKYSKNFDRIISNEKLSIEKDYGKNIGTAQLMRSPYNDKRGMLVVTGSNTKDVYLASTQINFQKNIQQFTGDAVVVDMNNAHYGYRFKKNKAIDKSLENKRTFSKNSQLILYLGLALIVIILIGVGVILTVRKQGHLNGGSKHGGK